jgi:hypothetical protein
MCLPSEECFAKDSYVFRDKVLSSTKFESKGLHKTLIGLMFGIGHASQEIVTAERGVLTRPAVNTAHLLEREDMDEVQ